MKKEADVEFDDDILPEYDFSGAKRSGAYRSLSGGYTIREEHPDGTVTITHVGPSEDAIRETEGKRRAAEPRGRSA
jgi:hypothetical protein